MKLNRIAAAMIAIVVAARIGDAVMTDWYQPFGTVTTT